LVGSSEFSIPFIAGQWSLHERLQLLADLNAAFQSPSLRGSGRFSVDVAQRIDEKTLVFNPLHCGAVVASAALHAHSDRFSFFNPLHCGAVVASKLWQSGTGPCHSFSIPFIAGQWSLLERHTARHLMGGLFSIPFIAGQWSLPAARAEELGLTALFQSPSLRGSGRFGPRSKEEAVGTVVSFQSPSLRGSGRFGDVSGSQSRAAAGFQSPSLRGSGRFESAADDSARDRIRFQSPSLRGSGRFAMGLEFTWPAKLVFQSPSLRGSGRFPGARGRPSARALISIPFIAGQWSLRCEA